MNHRAIGTTGLLVLAAMVGVTTPARAQEELPAADVASARALGQEGVRLADAGNCAEALDQLSRAEKLFHAPTTLARLGECQVNVGKIVEGTENLNRVARENIAPSAPSAFREAQERARRVLADAKPRIARLKVAVAAPGGAQIVVKIDGGGLPLANLNVNRPIDPGEHTVEVSALGYKSASAKVRLPEGGQDTVALTLEVDPDAPPATGGAPASAGGGAAESPNRAPAYIVLGIGAAGLGVGAVFGLLAAGKKGDLDSACANKVCATSEKDTIDSGRGLATISTVGFAVGIAGAAVGTILMLTSGRKVTTGGSAVRVGGATIEPTVSRDRLGLAGTF